MLKKSLMYNLLAITGLLIAVYGLVSSFVFHSYIWYAFFVIGGTFFLTWINFKLKNESLFDKNFSYLLKTYLIYLLLGIFIELIGRFLLNLWIYPYFGFFEEIIYVLLIGYPFAFFFIYESFKIISKFFSFNTSLILTLVLNSFLHEIPNTFSWEWMYLIPFFKLYIFKINIIVIIGWSILIAVPFLRNYIFKKFRF